MTNINILKLIKLLEEKGTINVVKGKRLEAMIIDYFAMVLMFTCIGLFFIMCFRQFGFENPMMFIFIICYTFIFVFLFFFLTDYLTRGGGIGKKKVGIRLLSDGKEFDTAMVWKHSVLKMAACCIWPISLIYFLKTGRMFYDRWLKLEVAIEEGQR